MLASEYLNKCHFGDVRAVLKDMIRDGVRVQTIVCSPPYWGLRSYLPSDHPDKAREIGSEPTLGEFLQTMVGVFDLCREVLADDGTMWINMGDSYATGTTSNRAPTATGKHGYWENAAINRRIHGRDIGLKPKDLIGQPWRLAFALQDAGWWLRQDIIWSKPNPMPESTRDRCTKAHEYIFLMSKAERYYFDAESIAEPFADSSLERLRQDIAQQKGSVRVPGKTNGPMKAGGNINSGRSSYRPGSASNMNDGEHVTKSDAGLPVREAGRNKRSVWTVPTESYSGAHFATFPRALIEPCILAGAPVGGTVLDIFLGSGTTAQVAEKLGRKWIGIDIDERNGALQADRLRQPSLDLEAA